MKNKISLLLVFFSLMHFSTILNASNNNLNSSKAQALELIKNGATREEWEALLVDFKKLNEPIALNYQRFIESILCTENDNLLCIEKCEEAHKLFLEDKDDVGIAISAKELSAKYTIISQYKKAAGYSKICTLNCKEKYPNLYIDCYYNIAVSKSHSGDYVKNRKMLFEILDYINEKKLARQKGKIFMNIASSFHYQAILDSAMYYYEIAVLELMHNDSFLYARILNNMGIISTTLRDFDKAKELFEISLDIYQKIGKSEKTASIFSSIGTLMLEQGKLDTALVYYKKSKKIAENNYDSTAVMRALINTANVYFYQEKFEQALEFGKQATEYALAIGDSSEIAKSINNNAYSLMKLKRFDEAKKNIDTALEIAKRINDMEMQHLALVAMADYHLEQKDFEKALYAYVEATDVKSTFINEKQVAQYTEMQTKYKTAEKELMLKEKDLDIANERAKSLSLQIKVFIISIILLFVVLLSGFLFWIQRNKSKNLLQQTIIEEQDKSIQAVLQVQEEERQRIAKELHDGIVQDLTTIKLALDSLKSQVHPENQEKVEKIVSQLDKSTRETREISHQMMPLALRELGLIPAIEDIFERSFKPLDIQYDFECVGMENRISEKQEISLFRIIQELINNCIKHSEANKVHINLQQTDKHILLVFEDNGKGFNESNANNGIGMQNLNSRVKIINGVIRFESEIDKGLTVILKIPKLV